ncbi:hypothetical protein PHYSODRAFT_332204 [Phytophthora sojae]|uniref:Uncharacterized protein n=1 Tax=Phytophthora sojae (strain P6497) TaxID=1094619 RepID=G4ZED5_PHYSP|nr:hypothetical protein PHYSODRAFT_332204 [Phytophthora sojae]EGZ18400.1 hypothetical protein PHYSODRAFT_332204 [Phytophthora sojae]|eukprot:XP_009527458.1 hypothetical protein PHYSODRAFT_332204 [Phytophthora sojae]
MGSALPALRHNSFGHYHVSATFVVPEDPKRPQEAWGLNLREILEAVGDQSQAWAARIQPALGAFHESFDFKHLGGDKKE